jgi:hypothetical protein
VKTSPEILQLCIQKKALEQVHTSTSQHKLKLARVESVMKRTIQGGKYIYTVPSENTMLDLLTTRKPSVVLLCNSFSFT